jgi:tRNA dimethylallyltransferase
LPENAGGDADRGRVNQDAEARHPGETATNPREPLLVVLLGPTASGKTSLSLALAERFSGEIVSCDSVAVYREMEIGTAKPDLADRRRIAHHLIDVVSPDEPYTAGDYSRAARGAIAQVASRGRLPIVTGGTGLYLRALIDGLFVGPQRSEPLRERLRGVESRRGAGWLHRVLRRLDPEAAARIHCNDVPKVIRGIEVCLSARRPMTEAWSAGRDVLQGFRILRIGLNPDRAALYARINQRAAAMFEQGLVEETAALIARYGEAARPLDSLGYKQAKAVLGGELTLEAAVAAAQQGHRNFAKRQLTWFRREPEVRWLAGFGDSPEIREQAGELVAGKFASADG